MYYDISTGIAFADSAIFNVFFAFLGLSIWYVIRFSHPDDKNVMSLIFNHLFSAMLIVSVWLISGYLLLKHSITEPVYAEFLENSFPWRIISGLFYYSVFAMLYYVIVYYFSLQEKLKAEAQLKSVIQEVELSALKSQINPHFLFNSLNSISSLTITSPEKAQEMIIELSDYLRYSLSTRNEHTTSLRKELDNINRYLSIEQIRFGHRMEYKLDHDLSLDESKIPSMILQPIFENAIKHGVYESTELITISFHAKLESEQLKISVSNNFDPTARPISGEGLGLSNIQERLVLIYIKTDLLKVEKQDQTFCVHLTIPQS